MSRFTLIEAVGRPQAPAPRLAPDRRDALKLMMAGVATTMAACGRPNEKIIPYVEQPEGLTPGVAQRYATTLPLGGYGRGAMAIAYEGRPTKIEGSPKHPFSQGSTDVFLEAEVLSLYDPARLQTVTQGTTPSSWDTLDAALIPRLLQHRKDQGRGLTLLTTRITSPTELRLIKALQGAYPAMRWRRYEAVDDDNARAGARLAFGRTLDARPRLQDAKVVVCLDADPLGPGPEQIANGRAYAARRKADDPAGYSRWYAVEGGWSLTGANADHRLAHRPDRIADVASALAAELGQGGGQAMLSPQAARFVKAAAADLKANGGHAVVLVGRSQPPEVHALAHALNASLKAPVDAHEPVDPHPDAHMASLQALVSDLRSGQVGTLLVLGGDPAYAAPAELLVRDALSRAPFSIHFTERLNDTSAACQWQAPLSHALESWGDLRAPDGAASLVQPLVRPLYATRSRVEVLDRLSGDPQPQGARSLVQATWNPAGGPATAGLAPPPVASKDAQAVDAATQRPGPQPSPLVSELEIARLRNQGAPYVQQPDAALTAFERTWIQALSDGVVANSAAVATTLPAAHAPLLAPGKPANGFVLALAPDPSVYDGAYAENAWLQECPKPLTSEVWGANLAISPEDAAAHGLKDGDNVRLGWSKWTVVVPVRIAAGQAQGALHGFIGGGRQHGGPIGSEVGWNFSRLRDPANPWMSQVTLEPAAGRAEAPFFQAMHRLDGDARDLSPELELASLPRLARAPLEKDPDPPSLLPPAGGWEPSWAMVIDAELCTGCNACVVSCQSENNVPVVGPHEIARGRDMHWLRIDAYDVGRQAEHRPAFQPVPCMQCEHAPCEPVCPVEASVHDHEGLNDQVYNRCVGTRFCQSNCPYKVRRFNWYGYSHDQAYGNMGAESVKALENPEVTVRARGVMEKCTYCVQRISAARRAAEKGQRSIGAHEVVTACQSACPTQAISFGDLKNPQSGMAALREAPRHYALLGELGTRPRTTYLARLRNPNPALEPAGGEISS